MPLVNQIITSLIKQKVCNSHQSSVTRRVVHLNKTCGEFWEFLRSIAVSQIQISRSNISIPEEIMKKGRREKELFGRAQGRTRVKVSHRYIIKCGHSTGWPMWSQNVVCWHQIKSSVTGRFICPKTWLQNPLFCPRRAQTPSKKTAISIWHLQIWNLCFGQGQI